MSFSAFSASCGFSNSHIGIGFRQMGVDAFYRRMSIILIFPEVENIFMMWSLITFLVSLPMCSFPFLFISFCWFTLGAWTPPVVTSVPRRTWRAWGAAGAGAGEHAGTAWAARCYRWTRVTDGACAGAGAQTGGRTGPRPEAAATTGSAVPLWTFISAGTSLCQQRFTWSKLWFFQ